MTYPPALYVVGRHSDQSDHRAGFSLPNKSVFIGRYLDSLMYVREG